MKVTSIKKLSLKSTIVIESIHYFLVFDERSMDPALDKVKPNIRKLYSFLRT